jgi:hypothetical protein
LPARAEVRLSALTMLFRDRCLPAGCRWQTEPAVSGSKRCPARVDQAAGLVWRCRDPDYYYIVREEALEDNVVVLYNLQNGQRLALAPKGNPSKTTA